MTPSFIKILHKTTIQPARWHCIHPRFCDERARSHSPRFLNWLKTHSHKHTYREIIIVLAGSGFYGIGNDLIKCRPGNIFFFEAGQQHQNWYPPFSPDGVHVWISLILHHASAQIVMMRKGKTMISGGFKYFKSYPEIGVWPDRCWPEEIPPGLPIALYRIRLLSALSILLTDIIQTGFCQPHDNQHTAIIKRTFQAIQDHVWETGGRDASLDNLSRIAGFSKYHFLRLFKKSTGQSIHSFVNTARINKYHELLKARASKKQIAERLGFSCPAAFSRWLRQNIS